ncbi:MAG: NifU family protein [Pseudomonadota bacterium]
MFIQTEETPNPNTIKFLPGSDVIGSGAGSSLKEFCNAEEAASNEFAKNLFSIDNVTRVFYGADFISVTKNDEADWDILKTKIMALIMDHMMAGLPFYEEDTSQSDHAINEDDDEITVQIKALLDERVRPAVAMDGGDILFDRFDDGIVYLHMRGACAGCPSSTMTLKSGIENMLKHYIPEVLEVRPAQDY